MTSAQLAVQLEVSVRTIYRDLDILSKNGIPVSTTQGKGGGVFLADGFDKTCVQDCLLFNEDEKRQLIELLMGGDAAGQHKPARGQNEAGGQLETDSREQTKKSDKPDKTKKASGTDRIDDAAWIQIVLPGSDFGERQSRIVEQIHMDIEKRHPVSLLYRNGKGDRSRRMVEPAKLIFQDNTWYLYGYCRKRKEFRYFKLSRIEEYISEKETFSPRAEGQIRPLRQKEKAEMTELSLRIEERLSDRVFEELAAGEITRDGDVLAVRIQMPEEERTYAYLLSYGSALEVAGPKRVRKDMKRRIKEMQKKY